MAASTRWARARSSASAVTPPRFWALNVTGEPISGLVVGGLVAGVLGVVTGPIILRTRGLTLIMLTLAITSMLAGIRRHGEIRSPAAMTA